MSNEILVEVKEIEKDNIPHLCFIYQDKSEEFCEILGDDGKPYIEKDDSLLSKKTYFLVGSDAQFESRIESGDFKDCIFLRQPYFEDKIFTEQVDFHGAIFTEKADFKGFRFTKQAGFWGAEFTKEADFWGAKFTEQADFRSAIFTKQADFRNAEFTKQVDFETAKFIEEAGFEEVEFTKKANFRHSKFTKDANFLDAIFIEQADFRHAEFTKKANFQGARFDGSAGFQSATFTEQANFLGARFINPPIGSDPTLFLIDFAQAQFLTTLNLHGVKFINLNLYQSQLDNIYYDTTSTTFNVLNRETILILKSIALKQHDKIKALEFSTQEYEQHWDKLNWSTNFSGKLILGFEKLASYFGTSIILSVSWYFGFAGLFYLFMNRYDVIDTKTIITETFINFIIPTNIEVGDFFINNCYSLSSLDYILFVIYKILQITLLYEMIKTFRQYSRNL